MKDKNRITVMICTAANGSKVPLAVIGKAAKPTCFRLCENEEPPIAYTHQKNSWFDKVITVWWINNVFIPSHRQKWGDSDCILILDNCTAHKIDTTILPTWFHLIFRPPNMTSNFQPADMGMIASLKIGYKAIMLQKLLDIFDAEGGFEGAANIRRTVRKGQRGLDYGGKATIVDAMYILDAIWKEDQRYARQDGTRRCWRKAGILPIHMNTTIDSELGSASMSLFNKTLPKEECDQLCELMIYS
jgi:DDE superfamily endonuclease